MAPPDIEHIQDELRILRQQYAQLKQEKEEQEQRFEKDYQKWKRFKKWLILGKGKIDREAIEAHWHSPRKRVPPTPQSLQKVTNSQQENESKRVDERPVKKIRSPPRASSSKLTKSPPSTNENKPVAIADVSLNSRYCLNPAHNDGLGYQFDEVVRNKQDRRKLDAGDCECCRDYYQTIKPLPIPMQPPLWRSPPTTPQKRRRLFIEEDDEDEPRVSLKSPRGHKRSVAKHQQNISRHRRRWETPKTPPGYWDIGFPDTQQIATINERAREIHAQKMRDAEAEASKSGGRYVRR